jgi:Tripartite tricarboxylate transporter family receptor
VTVPLSASRHCDAARGERRPTSARPARRAAAAIQTRRIEIAALHLAHQPVNGAWAKLTPHIAAGTLRVIGVTSAARSALFPDFPTIAETGLPDYQSLGWFGLFAPAGTPREIVAKVSADVGRVLALPDAKQRLADRAPRLRRTRRTRSRRS